MTAPWSLSRYKGGRASRRFQYQGKYLRKAVALNPTVIASRLELARSYVAVENWPSARYALGSVRALPIQFSDDGKHKQEAEQLLEEIRKC
jgi:hypothetical protein